MSEPLSTGDLKPEELDTIRKTRHIVTDEHTKPTKKVDPEDIFKPLPGGRITEPAVPKGATEPNINIFLGGTPGEKTEPNQFSLNQDTKNHPTYAIPENPDEGELDHFGNTQPSAAVLDSLDDTQPIVKQDTEPLKQKKEEESEFRKRMDEAVQTKLKGNLDDENLKRYIRALWYFPNSYFTLEHLNREVDILAENKLNYKPEQLAAVVNVLNKMIAEREKPIAHEAKKTKQPEREMENPAQSSDFVDKLSEAIHGKTLSQDEKYLEALKAEEWNNEPLQPIDARSAPDYYVDMIDKEKDNYKLRVELDNDAFKKRNGLSKPTLEALGGEIQWAGFEKGETKKLYEIPGVRRAMERIAQLTVSGQDVLKRPGPDGASFSFLTASNKEDIQAIREYIRREIALDVIGDFARASSKLNNKDLQNWKKRGLLDLGARPNDPILEFKCRDAEQIAFNMLYLGGFFESVDSQWVNGVRVREAQIKTSLTHPAIKDAMNPMDSLIDVLGKNSGSRALTGTIEKWASVQTTESRRQRKLLGVKLPFFRKREKIEKGEIKKVVLLDEDRRANGNLFWTFGGEKGQTLYAPECYPTKLVKSVWEETTVKVTVKPPNSPEYESERDLLSYLLRGEEIPWDKVSGGENMWGAYGSKLGKAGQTLSLLQGGTSVRWGEYENVRLWSEAVDNALAKSGRKRDSRIKRWILYASTGINPAKRAPTLNSSGRRFDILSNLGPNKAGYLNSAQELLFPWDQFGKIA